jgi:Ca-activated chloride channel family protein
MRVSGIVILVATFGGSAFAGDASAGLSGDAQIVPRLQPAAVSPSSPLLPKADIRADTDIVLVPVTVTDPLNRFVEGLNQDSFEVYEDKIRQKIVSFGCDDAPFSLGIIFDTSGSMGPKLERSRMAVAEFLKTANPQDEAFLVEFADRPLLTVPLTYDLSEIQNRLLGARPKGRTALLDSVYLALNTLKNAHNARKALLLITDGGDNRSRYSAAEVKNLLEESDVQLYAIGIYESGKSRNRTPEESSGPKLLTALSEPTGGRHFIVESLTELPDVAEKIGVALHNQYVIGYTPANLQRDGKFRRISVKVVQPGGLPLFSAYWRYGYTAPTQ